MKKKQKVLLARIAASIIMLIILRFTATAEIIPNRYIRFLLYLVPYVTIGYDILWKAVRGIFHGQVFDENFLMCVATIGAFALAVYKNESFTEAVAVLVFDQIGEFFESYAVGKSRKNISELMDIRPDYANVETDGRLIKTDPSKVGIGSIIAVKPGEKIPIDGVVESGSSSLDTSALTGESVPRSVKTGDEVISGCINETGLLKIRTTKAFGESTASKILDLVENSSSKKAKSEKFITKFSRVYTPAVCLSALVLGILPPVINLIAGNAANWGDWVYRALTFLVISCPCALVISIPLSFFAGIGGASRQGILVKGANYLEQLSNTKYVAFDKTGTMTKGVFKVNKIKSSIGEEKLEMYAAAAESFSTHPIAKAVRDDYIKKYGGSFKPQVADVVEIGGHGVSAKVDNVKVDVGNEKLMNGLGIKCEHADDYGTVVHVAVDGKYSGYIIISDEIKENAPLAVEKLKKIGVKKTVMLTGDRKKTADYVAEKTGVDAVYSELLPADKVEKVEELMKNKGGREIFAFAGDGINDAPVLSRADIGIAMGAMGSDAAIEAADVVLMDDDPVKIPKAIAISKKCLKIVYENIYFAIGIKLICLVLSAFGIGNMWLAIFADTGVMILAVLNAMRCLKVKNL